MIAEQLREIEDQAKEDLFEDRLDGFGWAELLHRCYELDATVLLQLIPEVRRLQRERDAAVEDLSTYKDCGFCSHLQDQQYCYKNCQRHVDVDNFRTHPCWQWRGPDGEAK